MLEFIKANPLAVVALCALLVSLASLWVATRALRQQREHNFRTVKPIAHVSKGDYEDCLFVKLKNYGSGPLLIDSFLVESRDSTHKRIIDALGAVANGHTWDTFTDTIDGRALAPKEEFLLLKGTFGENQDTLRLAVRKCLSEMTLRVRYSDVYDRKQTELVEKLSWFARD